MTTILMVGDIVGRPGRKILAEHLPQLVRDLGIDLVVANLENAAGGFGITPEVMQELDRLPVDVWTSGNHIWDKKEGIPILDAHPYLLRPANYPEGNPGRGWCKVTARNGAEVAVINLQGRTFMNPIDDPFRKADEILAVVDTPLKVVDFHAEATSEKQALGFYLDGRVTAVLGTHTHVPTADERILPKGTAFQTDVGMTGPYESVIGTRVERVLHRFLKGTPASFDVAKRDVRLMATLVVADSATGKASKIERVEIRRDS